MKTKIKEKNGNIPIRVDLLNKYENVTDLMIKELFSYNDNVRIRNFIPELYNIDLKKLNNTEIYHLAVKIFCKYHKTKEFFNDGNIICVSNADIKESLNKILHNSSQEELLLEHLRIFGDLGNIIEHSTLVAQSKETKNITQNTHIENIIWSYYLIGLKINKKIYLFEFDVVTRGNNQNHYRVQRLQEIKQADISAGNIAINNITPALEISAVDSNIT